MEHTQPEKTYYPPLLTEKEAAPILGVNVKTLQNWRWRGIGPSYIKASAKHVRYRLSDLNDFLNSKTIKPILG